METDRKYIGLSLRYGLIGAVVFPFIYESYANIMHSFAVILAAAGCIFVGLKLSRLAPPNALSASAFFIVLSSGLGAFLELMMHSHVVAFLEKRSKYFYMSYKEIAVFAVCILMCYMIMIIICFGRIGISSAIKHMKTSSAASGNAIDNAFGDDDE